MKLSHRLAALIAAAFFVAAPAWAGPGNDHDHGDAAPAPSGQRLPRFAAESDLFELVGVLKGQRLTLYLDRFADNSPVAGARIELDIGGAQFTAEPQGEDGYDVLLPAAPKPGVLPVTATVTAGTDTDLLAGELDIPEGPQAHPAAHAHPWTGYAGWAAAGLVSLGLLIAGGRAIAAHRTRAGGAA